MATIPLSHSGSSASRLSPRLKMAFNPGDTTIGKMLGAFQPSYLTTWEKVCHRPEREILVVGGQQDNMAGVLRRCGLLFSETPYIYNLPFFLNGDSKIKAIIADANPDAEEDIQDSVSAISSFVEAGGLLISSDWSLSLVERAFPGTIRRSGKKGQRLTLTEKMYKIEPRRVGVVASRFPMSLEEKPEVKILVFSHPIQIISPLLVETLIYSKELEKSYGSGAVAVRFKYGRGWVVHMIYHMSRQIDECMIHPPLGSMLSLATFLEPILDVLK